MIIVSQDKDNILNFDNTINVGIEEISTLNDTVEITAQTNGTDIVLGRYENEDRAKEVLQEIIKQKAMFELYRLLPTGGREQTEMLKRFVQKRIILDKYEMPEE